MKILALSDEVSPEIYSDSLDRVFGDVELVLSCGDLPFDYLEYVVSILNVPLLYVHGNHDQGVLTSSGEILVQPRGCVDVGGRIVQVKGLLIGGLDGCSRYRPGAAYQYSEWEMRLKIFKMAPRLWRNRLTKGRALDILLTHAPPYGIHDAQDQAHRGFRSFLWFMERYRPKYLIHGHTHPRMTDPRPRRYGDTEVIHVYGYKVLDIPTETEGRGRRIAQGVGLPVGLR